MTTKDLGFRAPPSLAVAVGATTPNPGVSGALIWSTTASAPLVWDGSKWAAIGGAVPASTFVQAVAYTPSADHIDITGLSASYDYTFVLDDLRIAAYADYIAFRASTTGGSSFASGSSDYTMSYVTPGTNSTLATDSHIRIAAPSVGVGSAASATIAGRIQLHHPGGTTFPKTIEFQLNCVGDSTTSSYHTLGTGTYRGSTSAVDAVRIYTNTAVAFAAGQVLVYRTARS